jgi:MerR family copper efflux transcriptional regulator
MDKLKDFLRISEAAEYLGVSPNTLRNWENAGKIAAHRHPVNGYRLFKQEELDALLRPVQSSDPLEPEEDSKDTDKTSQKKPR